MDEETKQELEAIWKLLRGNGHPGFMERVRLIELTNHNQDERLTKVEETMNAIQESILEIQQYRETQKAEWRGFKKAIWLFFGVITFLIGGGYAAIIATLRVMLSG